VPLTTNDQLLADDAVVHCRGRRLICHSWRLWSLVWERPAIVVPAAADYKRLSHGSQRHCDVWRLWPPPSTHKKPNYRPYCLTADYLVIAIVAKIIASPHQLFSRYCAISEWDHEFVLSGSHDVIGQETIWFPLGVIQ